MNSSTTRWNFWQGLGAKLKEVARALGIPALTLRQWRDRLVGQSAAPAGQTAAALVAENLRRLSNSERNPLDTNLQWPGLSTC